ncbi:hypothetical protein KQ944_18345 [Bacillus subtilis]|uniref:hypothetical protein n=1 Tax=Pseudochrobactrum asaccharolyticum TaxID=354351 RepID=UPI001F2D9189|nr:hypothetical protein [Pseudochrobactrum asaccharolyticum]MCF7647310.1 hypothetical protein [Pseudochrobactrum asaccharolyticum]MCF7673601.1 hypothetical protein [Bacillus subtilis]
MPIVKMPDGAQVRFPDDMPREQIRDMIASKFPEVAQQVPKPPVDDPRDSFLGKVDATMRGAADMMSFGFADEIAAGGDALFNPIFGSGQDGESFSDRYNANLKQQRGIDDADYENRFGYRLGGQLAGGLTGGVGMAKSGLSASANAVNAGKSLGKVAIISGLEGAGMGMAHGFGSGEGVDGRISSAKDGGKYGGLLGLAAPVAIAGATNGIKKLVSPYTLPAERQAMAQALKHEGVELTAGQVTGSDTLRYAESEIGGRVAKGLADRQREQFTRAALKRIGIDAERATPEVIDNAFTTIGKQFDDLAYRNNIVPDQKLAGDLKKVYQGYAELVNESARAPIVENVTKDIVNSAQKGNITGDAYQSLRSRLQRAARSTKDSDLAGTLRGIGDALDEAMARSILKTNPSDIGGWQQARRQYKNLLVIEKSLAGAGENTALGMISPSQLRNAATQQGRRAYVRGQGDFAELARAGEALMKPMPNSGTAGRLSAQSLKTGILPALGAAAGSTGGLGLGTLAGFAAGKALPAGIGRLMMSAPVQSYLVNQAASGAASPQLKALLNALANTGGSGVAGRLPSP